MYKKKQLIVKIDPQERTIHKNQQPVETKGHKRSAPRMTDTNQEETTLSKKKATTRAAQENGKSTRKYSRDDNHHERVPCTRKAKRFALVANLKEKYARDGYLT